MAETVKVIVRCRPMNTRENDLKCKEVVAMDSRIGSCGIQNPGDDKAPPKRFTFDGAYGTDSTTEQIYADIGFPLVEGVTEGYNGTIFAYGQTGCGKSFSMQGITDPATQRGIIPRAFDHVFETIQVAEGTKYLVHASYLEIYNEEIRDLLGKDVKKKMDLKEHPERGVYCQGLSMHPCTNVHECNKIMRRGWDNRSTGATLMNADSSRSHSIFTIYLERIDPDESGEEHIRAAKLNLVDLAGSERQSKTGATGDRLKEATKINLSLSALGNVISALVDGKSKHIPYRDSKLTRMLQDSLGGNTKTLMVACLSPADNNYDETLSTLRYANRAKNIKNKPKINEDPKDALLREYQEEINRLKAMLAGELPLDLTGGNTAFQSLLRGKKGATSTAPAGGNRQQDSGNADQEVTKIKEEYEEKMAAMHTEFEEMKISRDKMEEEMEKLREVYEDKITTAGSTHVTSPGQTPTGGEVMSYDENNELIPVKLEVIMPDGAVIEMTQTELSAGIPPGAQVVGLPEGDVDSIQERIIQHAVHLATEKTVGDQGQLVPPRTPSASPAGDVPHIGHQNITTEAMKKLEELQRQMVGGEEATNEEVKERHLLKKQHVEERKRKLAEALANMQGEDIMLGIYDNIHDELRDTVKFMNHEKDKNETLSCEIKDLQAEFEFDRIDYLDTIRRLEQELAFKDEVVKRIHPTVRKDSNFVNLDKVRAQSKWDEVNLSWNMPQLTLDRTQLPTSGPLIQLPSTAAARQAMNDAPMQDNRTDDKLRQRLNKTDNDGNNYFEPKRQKQLLNQRNQYNGTGSSPVQNGLGGGGSLPLGLQPAQQMSSEGFPLPKPTRLAALPLQQPVSKKRNKKKLNDNDYY